MSEYGVHLSEYGLHLHVTRSGLEVTSTRVQFSAPPADRRPGSGTRTREPRVRSRASGVGGARGGRAPWRPVWVARGSPGPSAERRDLLRYYRYQLRGLTRPAHGVRLRAVRSRVETPGSTVHSTYAYGDTGDNQRANVPGVTATSAWAHWRGWSEVIRDSPRTRTDHVGAQRGAGSAPGVVPRRRPRPGTVRVHTRGVRGPPDAINTDPVYTHA
jgi:hypothetical protein